MSALGHEQTQRYHAAMSALPPKADIERHDWHVRFVPCVDGSELARLFFTFAGWSVQPCVRPVCAVHMTAGHNALPRIRSRSKARNRDALAQVGCPDRRIDRLCITCCWASQPSHHAGCRRDRSRRECDGFLVAITSGHHSPRHFRDLVGERVRAAPRLGSPVATFWPGSRLRGCIRFASKAVNSGIAKCREVPQPDSCAAARLHFYSITSARMSSVSETFRPSALAVVRLM